MNNIIFITKNNHKVSILDSNIVIQSEFTDDDLSFIKSLDYIGFDLETNDLDPFIGNILLMIIGSKDKQYVIDATTINCENILLNLCLENTREIDKIILGANLKFDYKFIKVKYNIEFNKMFDVMIAEQRLLQGFQVSSSLAAITERRLKIIRNKNVRNDFIGANVKNFIFNNLHIEYGAEDISYLFDIKEQQKIQIEKNNQKLLIYGIEFPLIKVLAESELEGFYIDEIKWKENILNNEESKFKVECELDEEIQKLKENLPKDQQIYLSHGKYNRKRIKKPTIESTNNLFGDAFHEIEVNNTAKIKSKAKEKSPYINYSSSSELLNIFGRLGQPAPTLNSKNQQGDYVIPKFIIKKGKEVIDKSMFRFTTGAKTMETYLIENPSVTFKNFITNIIKYRKFSVRLNTFGEQFLVKYKNKVTNKFHTIYRQCHAITGRLQSGDTKNGWFNSQNIPAKKEYRECFHANGEYVITSDLSGAEAVIMIDKAKDEKFYQLAIVNDDAHSPLCQAVWRAIGNYRKDLWGSIPEEYVKGDNLSKIIISKEVNKDMRTAYKPMTFGDIYGMGVKKRAKTLGVTEEESKIAGKVQKSMIPKTYAMVEANEKFAIKNGYIILNHRTNSKIYYASVLEAKKNNSDLDSYSEHEVKNSARNSPIQGTQADMVKEMLVEIAREDKRQKLRERFNFALLSQVHDELVYKSNDVETLIEFINENNLIEQVTIPKFVNKMMCKVGNRYLSFIQITAETVVKKTWTK